MIDLTADKNFKELKAKFDDYYERILQPKLQENDKIRNRYFGMFIVLLIMAAIFYPLVLLMLITKLLRCLEKHRKRLFLW